MQAWRTWGSFPVHARTNTGVFLDRAQFIDKCAFWIVFYCKVLILLSVLFSDLAEIEEFVDFIYYPRFCVPSIEGASNNENPLSDFFNKK